jgi:hypothetical protein
MAKFAGKALNFTVNAVAIEGSMNDSTLNITQETPEVTTFADAGPRRVVGNYDYTIDLKGMPDFASGNSDATVFALVGSSGVATGWDPTGASAATNDPNYDSTNMVLGSYSISAKVGGAVEMTATLLGNAALTRAVS